MYRILCVLLIWSFCGSKTIAQELPVLLKNVQYIDVLNGKTKKANVLLAEGRIQKMGKRINSSEATVVDGNGKWLIPGLVDAHIHLFQSGGLYTRPDIVDLRAFKPYAEERQWLRENAEDLLKRYLRQGITSVVDMGGSFSNFEIREQLKDKSKLPNLFLTGPLIATYQPEELGTDDLPIIKVTSEEEARELVRQQVAYQADFVKIWYIVFGNQTAASNYSIVKAIVEESHKNDLPVAVHATQLETAKKAIEAGADILVHSVDEPLDEEFMSMIAESKTAYIPTLIVGNNYVQTFKGTPILRREDFKYAHPLTLGSLSDGKHLPVPNDLSNYEFYLPQMEERQMAEDSINRLNLMRLHKANTTIAVGTDAGNIGTLHASSYHRELESMQKVGLSPLKILQYATANGAKMLGKENELGTVSVGKKADLVLLNANPLEDIQALQNIAYVIKDGALLEPDTIIVTESPENLVQQQVNGYNARNIEAFMAPYSDDFEIYNYPNTLRKKGKQNIRGGYVQLFEKYPNLHCEIVNRMVLGNMVIDHERVTGVIPNSSYKAIAIYTIENGKIVRVTFL